LSPKELDSILSKLVSPKSDKLLVSSDTHDDAAVYKLNDDTALIFTTDFFPPLCSDPYEFGQIAAANSLSDVYAMGGTPLLCLNIILFPSDKIPNEALYQILKGGQDKVEETGAMIVGGHTIDDFPPKYGLAVVGTVHPDKVITNSQSKAGDILILTKPLGMGIITAGKRLDEVRDEDYQRALDYMKLLNKNGAELMQKYNVKAATDITGFSLLGHALKMCKASNVSMEIDSSSLPVLAGAYELADMGCLPGAAFRNQDFAEPDILLKDPDYNLKMIGFDAQTSGGLLISSPPNIANQLLQELRDNLYPDACIIGKVTEKKNKHIELS
ncbi:MAG: selenide, water dikinase SelD, partial [Candidatus Cloacimonadales bacterium]|nr:selenide, water dikinase SelD [Candidatus Cloacimonadales bacterium]